MAAWRGIAAPKGMPADVQTKLLASLQKATSPRSSRTSWPTAASACCAAPPAEFASFMVKSDADLGATMKAVGIAK